jgi:glycosyltransferase involved in cell wall biosynthesis
MYNFTVIIPHKNTPDLLQRCLDTIPHRDDLQVIVVDDNSDKVDFSNFPGLNRPDTEIIFSKGDKGKGPGYARNYGISKAQGKWIIFADADDYFNESFKNALEEYKHAKEEIIFFKCTLQKENDEILDYALVNDAIDDANKHGNTDAIVYGVPAPWAKFIKRNFLQKHSIRYQEITGGDDILFSIRMAIKLKSFALSEYRLYCVVERPGSLTRNNQWQSFYSYVLACCDAYKLLKTVNKEKLSINWTISWWGFLWTENKFQALRLVPRIYSTMGIKRGSSCIKKGMKRGAWNWRNN